MATTKSTAAKKPAAKAKSAPKTTPLSKEEKLAASALKLIDEAAAALRKGVTVSAQTTAKSRETAKKRAHSLLGKAHDTLTQAVDAGTSTLHKVISKI